MFQMTRIGTRWFSSTTITVAKDNFYHLINGILRSQNLRKKRVNHDNSGFARKQRTCVKAAEYLTQNV